MFSHCCVCETETPIPSPLRPFLVVIRITPLEAREPYKAVAAAPFNTDIDSKSSAFRFFRSLPQSCPAPVFVTSLSMIIPSITKIGWLLPPKEVLPRMMIRCEDCGPELPMLICTPATLPCKPLIGLGEFTLAISSPFSSVMA